MVKTLWKPALPIVISISAILACTINIGGPSYPTPAIPISTEAVAIQQQQLQTAIAAGETTGQVQLVLTEPGLSSLLYYYLEEQEEPLFTNPQVYLRENRIRIHGTAQQGNLQAYIYIVLSAGIGDDGSLAIELTSADFGPLPVPGELLSIVSATITEAYTGALGPVATGFRLDNITIADGIMILSGRIR